MTWVNITLGSIAAAVTLTRLLISANVRPYVKQEPVEGVFAVDTNRQGSYRPNSNRSRNKPGGREITSTGLPESDPKGTNPLNRFGKRTKCTVCESVYHWAKDCPDRNRQQTINLTQSYNDMELNQSTQESVNITLFSKVGETKTISKNEIFMTEAFGAAAFDTVYAKTVCGQAWLDNYKSKLHSVGSDVKSSSTRKHEFRFGDGVTVA
ncbi:hypothetical protein HOLleu_10961 [Holothuria leucospilota]|uniref:Uncharacterized protein n=1 Tax=Holothuria leucospilota TaxID=206669 RepID=A0A9Q1CEP2_HOLLE|nr:hypothetical protein HOLleu_10961 [Holothuria leucospilota]